MTPPELQASGKAIVMHSTAKNDSVAARCFPPSFTRSKISLLVQISGAEEEERAGGLVAVQGRQGLVDSLGGARNGHGTSSC